MNIPDIILLKPNRVWRTYQGGKNLDRLEGRPDPADGNFPEDWIASTTKAVNKGRENLADEGVSRVEIEGKEYLLTDILNGYPEQTTGIEHYKKYGANTYFLMKLLDSAVRLHIQCHPTIPFAKKFLNSNMGKTEAYVILSIREEIGEPYIYLGFQKPPDRESFKETVTKQDIPAILSCFEKIYIKPGDVFVVPGGLPHAIGEGVFMVEIMEPTDLVVRIEFERGGYVLPEQSRFMGRGVDFALSMFNFDKIRVEDVRNKYFIKPALLQRFNEESAEYSLIDERATGCFRVKKITARGKIEKKEKSFYAGVVSKGSGRISGGNISREVRPGDKFFVTARTGKIGIESKEGMEMIISLPPE